MTTNAQFARLYLKAAERIAVTLEAFTLEATRTDGEDRELQSIQTQVKAIQAAIADKVKKLPA